MPDARGHVGPYGGMFVPCVSDGSNAAIRAASNTILRLMPKRLLPFAGSRNWKELFPRWNPPRHRVRNQDRAEEVA